MNLLGKNGSILRFVVTSSAFQYSFPLTLTSFVNKACQTGLALLPMILIDEQIDVFRSSLLLGAVKTLAVVGPWISGRACNAWKSKTVLLTSFVLSAIGLAGMAESHEFILLAFSAAIAQLGDAFFSPSARLLLIQLVKPSDRQEAVGWLRTANCLGQIFSYLVAAFFAALGLSFLILTDAASSLAAFIIGTRVIPSDGKESQASTSRENTVDSQPSSWFAWRAVLLVTGFSFLYELYIAGAAALFRQDLGVKGLTIFSSAMALNTFISLLLAVWASRVMRDPNVYLPVGLLLTGIGAALSLEFHAHIVAIFVGIGIFSLGGMCYGALGQYLLMCVAPAGERQGSFYGTSAMVQASGKVLSGFLAFPLVVRSEHPGLWLVLGTAPFLILWGSIRKGLKDIIPVGRDCLERTA